MDVRENSWLMEVGGGIDFEESEESELDVVGAGNAGWSAPGGGDESDAGQGGEDVAGGGPGGTAFGVEADHGALWGDGEADLAFDEAEDEQGQADDGDESGDAPVVLEVHGGDGQRSFEVPVASLDRFLALVAAQDFGGVGLGRVEVGQQGVPAVGGGLGVDGGLIEGPHQGRLGLVVAADVGLQVGLDFAVSADLGDPGGDCVGVGVVAAAQSPLEPFEVVSGSVEFLGPGVSGRVGPSRGPHEDPAQPQVGIGLAFAGQDHGVFDDPVAAPLFGRFV